MGLGASAVTATDCSKISAEMEVIQNGIFCASFFMLAPLYHYTKRLLKLTPNGSMGHLYALQLLFGENSTKLLITQPGNTKGGSITVQLTSCLTGLDQYVLQIKTKIVSFHIADSKPVKQEVNGTVILPPLVFPDSTITKARETNDHRFEILKIL